MLGIGFPVPTHCQGAEAQQASGVGTGSPEHTRETEAVGVMETPRKYDQKNNWEARDRA